MFLYRMLTKEQFGAWVLFLTIAAIIEVARIGLLQNALVKFLTTASDDDYPKISTASLVLNLGLTFFTVVGLLAFAEPVSTLLRNQELAPLLKIYALTNISLVPFFQFNYIQQANLDFKGIFWAAFARQGLFFLIVVGLFFIGNPITLSQLAIYQILAALVGSIVGFIFCKPFLRFSRAIDFGWIKKLFNFGAYVFGTNLSTQLFKGTDKFLLSSVLPGGAAVAAAAVAVYDNAIKITNLTDVPTLSMASVLFPQTSRSHHATEAGDNSAVKDLYEKAVGAILAFMIPAILAIMVLAEVLVTIIAGAEYIEAANILRVTILFGLFIPYAVQFGTVVDSIGRPRTNFLFTLFNLGLLIVIDYFFILKYGMMGAAVGTLLTYAITFVFMQIYLRRELGVNWLQPIKYVPFFYKKLFSLLSKKGQAEPLGVTTAPDQNPDDLVKKPRAAIDGPILKEAANKEIKDSKRDV